MSKKLTYLDAAGIDAGIKSIAKQGKKLDADIQHVGLSCLNHIAEHGDVRLFNRLFLAMPQGSRKTALTQWALAFGKLKANTEEGKKESPFVYDKDRETNLTDAAANPWYSFAPEKAPDEVFDVIKMLNALLAKAGKATTITNPEALAKLRDLAADLNEPAF